MAYVDGFVVPVPKKKLKSYLSMAKTAGKVGAITARSIRREHGRRRQAGQGDSFPQAVKLKKNETVWFSYIVYKSRATATRSTPRS